MAGRGRGRRAYRDLLSGISMFGKTFVLLVTCLILPNIFVRLLSKLDIGLSMTETSCMTDNPILDTRISVRT